MSWARVDDGWWCHPKVLGLPLAARGLWVSALSWSCAQRSALVPWSLLRMLGADEDDAEELAQAGLWEYDDDGWIIHDWAEYQDLSTSEKRAIAGAKGGQRSGEARRSKAKQTDTATSGNAEANRSEAKQGPKQARPDPTRPIPTGSTDPQPPSVASPASPSVVDESDVTRIIAKATRTLAESDPSVRSVDAVLPKRRTAMLTERGDEIRSRLARGDDPDDVIAWLTAGSGGPVDPLFGDRIVMAPGGTVPLEQSHVARALHRDRPDDADEPPAADPMGVIAEVRALRRTKTTAGEGASA